MKNDLLCQLIYYHKIGVIVLFFLLILPDADMRAPFSKGVRLWKWEFWGFPRAVKVRFLKS